MNGLHIIMLLRSLLLALTVLYTIHAADFPLTADAPEAPQSQFKSLRMQLAQTLKIKPSALDKATPRDLITWSGIMSLGDIPNTPLPTFPPSLRPAITDADIPPELPKQIQGRLRQACERLDGELRAYLNGSPPGWSMVGALGPKLFPLRPSQLRDSHDALPLSQAEQALNLPVIPKDLGEHMRATLDRIDDTERGRLAALLPSEYRRNIGFAPPVLQRRIMDRWVLLEIHHEDLVRLAHVLNPATNPTPPHAAPPQSSKPSGSDDIIVPPQELLESFVKVRQYVTSAEDFPPEWVKVNQQGFRELAKYLESDPDPLWVPIVYDALEQVRSKLLWPPELADRMTDLRSQWSDQAWAIIGDRWVTRWMAGNAVTPRALEHRYRGLRRLGSESNRLTVYPMRNIISMYITSSIPHPTDPSRSAHRTELLPRERWISLRLTDAEVDKLAADFLAIPDDAANSRRHLMNGAAQMLTTSLWRHRDVDALSLLMERYPGEPAGEFARERLATLKLGHLSSATGSRSGATSPLIPRVDP